MDDLHKAIVIALAAGLILFALGPSIWHPSDDISPLPEQIPFFIVLSLFSALATGTGIAFLIIGIPMLSRLQGKNRNRFIAMFAAIAWVLISWWPHDNMHMSNGADVAGLLLIEYVFHVTLMIAGVVLAVCFVSILRENVFLKNVAPKQ